jgi:hypothetical protein
MNLGKFDHGSQVYTQYSEPVHTELLHHRYLNVIRLYMESTT